MSEQHNTRSPRRSSKASVGAALALLSVLALAACGGSDQKAADSPEPVAATHTPKPIVSPLTGETLSSEPKHPVVIVKVDNTDASEPQIGLGSADLITEELVEGGITRLAVFFDSRIPAVVGPVRSMRATDIGVVQPARAVLVASGGAPQTVRRIAAAKIKTFTEGAKGYYRDPARYAPYNLMMKLEELVKTLKGQQPNSPILPFAAPGSSDTGLPKGKPAAGVDAQFSASSTTHWVYQDGHYVNTNSRSKAGERFTPSTVLVLRVPVGDAGYKDPAGNPVPETHFTGGGAALVFHGGRVVHAQWSKKGYDADLGLTARGKALDLPPGKVWVELVPNSTGKVSITKF